MMKKFLFINLFSLSMSISIIANLNDVPKIVNKEGLELLIISYGGSNSNTLVKNLELEGFTCQTNIWHKLLCHSPIYIDCNIPVIYIYDDPRKSFLSMKNRGHGFYDTNQQKLSNNKNCTISDENLLELMIKQFHDFTDTKRENVLIINSQELYKEGIVTKLNTFLNKNVKHFPIKWKKPKTSLHNINIETQKLFQKYKDEINKINNFKYNN